MINLDDRNLSDSVPAEIKSIPAQNDLRSPYLWKQIESIDLKFFYFLRRSLLIAEPLRRKLKIFVRIGDGWFWAFAALCLVSFLPWKQFISVLIHCLSAVSISLACYWPMKLGIRRIRPFEVLGGVLAEVPPLDRYSFPSGHTMNNLAVGLTLAYYNAWLGGFIILLPALWGILRIYFGVHYLSDIVGGAILGILSFIGGIQLFHWLPTALPWLL